MQHSTACPNDMMHHAVMTRAVIKTICTLYCVSHDFEKLHELKKKKHLLKISAVYLIGKAEIPIHYTIWALVEQALLSHPWYPINCDWFEYWFWFFLIQITLRYLINKYTHLNIAICWALSSWEQFMGYQGWDEILMIILISRKKPGGIKLWETL